MTEEPERPPFVLSDAMYKKLKWTATIVLPAAGTLYFAIAEIWGLRYGQQVLGTLIAVQAFFGVVLGVSSNAYRNSDVRFDGEINVSETPDKTIYSLDLKHDPEELNKKDEAVFKVNTPK